MGCSFPLCSQKDIFCKCNTNKQITQKTTINLENSVPICENKTGNDGCMLPDSAKAKINYLTTNYNTVNSKKSPVRVNKWAEKCRQATFSPQNEITNRFSNEIDKSFQMTCLSDNIDLQKINKKDLMGKIESNTANNFVKTKTTPVQDLNISGPVKYKNKRHSKSKKRKSGEVPIELINTPLTDEQMELIKNLLNKFNMLPEGMSEAQINTIFNSTTYLKFKNEFVIYSSDKDFDNDLYIVEKGKLGYYMGNEVKVVNEGETVSTDELRKKATKIFKIFTLDQSYVFSIPLSKIKGLAQDFIEKENEVKISFLKKSYFFNFLDSKTLMQLSNKCIRKEYAKETVIIEEKKISDTIYLIMEGKVQCKKNEELFLTLNSPSIFGDINIFTLALSIYSYTAAADTVLLLVPYHEYLQLLGKKPIEALTSGIFSNSVKKNEYLSKHLAGNRIKPVFDCFSVTYLRKCQISTVKQKKIYLPISGFLFSKERYKKKDPYYHNLDEDAIEIIQPKDSKKKLKTSSIISYCEEKIFPNGDLFINSILTRREEDNLLLYSNECVLLQTSWNDILKSIYTLTNTKITMYDSVHLLKATKMCRRLSEFKLFLLSDTMKVLRFKAETPLLKNGPASSRFFIIKSGEVKLLFSNKTEVEVQVLEKGASFGNFNSEYVANDSAIKHFDFVAKTNVECYVIEKDDYVDIVDNLSNLLMPLSKLLNVKEKNFSLDMFYFIRELGFGTYGKVYLVHNTKNFYAMKTADTQQMSGNKVLSSYYINEKAIMQSLHHPFIVKLINTFKTSEFIFFLMEYVEGITLREYIKIRPKENIRSKNEIIFYGGILFIILNYLHKLRIIHRDLKPENLMIETSGYLKAIDFNVGKDLSGKDSTHSLVGTPHYMPPEMILGKKYSFSVDYWSTGVILYELFYNVLPFGIDLTNSKDIFAEITEKKLNLPSDPNNHDVNILLRGLLEKNPKTRISSFAQVKALPLFKNIDFDEISEMKMKPIYRPARKTTDADLENKSKFFYTCIVNNMYTGSFETNSYNNAEKNTKAEVDYLSEF